MKRQQSFQNNKACLYLIASPIGNLKEISQRVIETLNKVEIIFCEDTRVTGFLLNNLKIKKTLISCPEFAENNHLQQLLNYLNNNQSVAYMSDAGYPCLSDPGNNLVTKVLENDFNVVVINGPSAAICALLASGLDTTHFYFHGFLDAKESARKKELETLKNLSCTLIFYVSPHKVLKTLEDIYEIFGDRKVTLAREMTKMYEEYLRGTISELMPICETLKGEMVLVCEGNNKQETISLSKAYLEVIKLIKQGTHSNEAIKIIANNYHLNKKELYNYYLENKH